MIVRIGGVKGIGKSTTVASFVDILREKGLRANTVSDFAHDLGITPATRRNASQSVRSEARQRLLTRIDEVSSSEPGRIIVRGAPFATYDEETRVFQAVPFQPNEGAAYLLVARPDLILSRRRLDRGNRPDRSQDPSFLDQEMEQEGNLAEQLTREMGIPLLRVDANIDPPAIAGEIFSHFSRTILDSEQRGSRPEAR